MVRRLFAILLLAAVALVRPGPAQADDDRFVAVNPPRAMPPFIFEDRRGHSLTLQDFHGRYVILNLWATFCAPCVKEMPTLNDLSKKLDFAKFTVIALSEDHDGLDVAHIFFNRHNIDHLIAYNDPDGRAPFALHMRGLPTTILINPDGLEIGRLEGPADWTAKPMMAFFKSLGR